MEREEVQKSKRPAEEANFQEIEILKQKREYTYFLKYVLHVDEEGKILQQARKKREACKNFHGYLEKNLLKSKCLPFLKQSAKQAQNLNLKIPVYNEDEEGRHKEYSKLREVLKKHRYLRKINISAEDGANEQELKDLSESLKWLLNLQSFVLDMKSFIVFDGELQRLGRCFKRICNLKSVRVKFDQRRATIKGLQVFGTGLKRLSFLEDINLSFGWFESKVFQGLGQSLKGMHSQPNNVNLGFDGVLLSSRDVEEVKLALNEFAFIQNLGFEFKENHDVNDEGLQVLNQSFDLLRLKRLRIDLSGPNQKSRETFIENLERASYLESLHLSFSTYANICGQEIIRLSNSLPKLHSLKDLNLGLLRCGGISFEALRALSQAFEKLTSLKNATISLSTLKEFTIKGYLVLLDGLRKAKGLEKTKLTFSMEYLDDVNDEDIQQFMEGLKELPSLIDLVLHFSRIKKLTETGLNAISESLKRMHFVQSVELHFMWYKDVSNGDVLELSRKLEGLPVKVHCTSDDDQYIV